MADPFRKSNGVNASEQRLTALANITFLRMWSFANLHVGRMRGGVILGKELSDLLVVCGDHVIVFSEKVTAWPKSGDPIVDWCRWCRKTVNKSVHQLRKAERWLREFPDSLFIDHKCQTKLPIELPNLETIKIHGVLIASGATEACIEHFKGGSGSLVIDSSIKDEEHINSNAEHFTPFHVGDVNTSGSFLHVFDSRNIRLLLHKLSTITDFVEYLSSRERFLRRSASALAAGEEDLLSFYLQTERSDGTHDFIENTRQRVADFDSVAIEEGYWRSYVSRPEYTEKKDDEKHSYIWDEIIEKFTKHLFDGTAPAIRDEKPEIKPSERALRIMAMESRVQRRGLSKALIQAMVSA